MTDRTGGVAQLFQLVAAGEAAAAQEAQGTGAGTELCFGMGKSGVAGLQKKICTGGQPDQGRFIGRGGNGICMLCNDGRLPMASGPSIWSSKVD